MKLEASVSIAERFAAPQGAKLASQHRQIVLGIVDNIAATEATLVIDNRLTVQEDEDAVGAGA